MQLESQITFRSTDLPSRCYSFFAFIKTQKKFCDVTFILGKHHILAHRIIVAAAIPYFQDTFAIEDSEITIPDVDPSVFECLIDFAYSCEVKISMENVRDLLCGACQLRMEEVRDACYDFIAERLRPDNVLVFRELANERHPQLIKIIDHYVKEHFAQISEKEEFLISPLTFMTEFIGKDDLHVDGEERVLEAVLKWVRASPDDRKISLTQLLRLVRMPLIPPLHLTDVAEAEELIWTSLENRNLLDEAKNYNLFPQRRKSTLSFSTKPRQFMPADSENCPENNRFIFTLTSQIEYTAQYLDFSDNMWVQDGRQEFCMDTGCIAVLKHKVYIFRWGAALAYDTATNGFEYVASPTVFRIHAGAAALKNKIYVCGGKVGMHNASSAVECYDPKTDEWTKVSSMRKARWSPQAVALCEYIYTVGGSDEFDVLDTVERYPSVRGAWTTMASMLCKRRNPGAAALNGKLYVCGGYTLPTGTECCETAEVFDPFKSKWEFISPMNTARCKFSLVSYHGKLYAIGGVGANGECLHSSEVYDPGNNKWTAGPINYSDNFLSAALNI